MPTYFKEYDNAEIAASASWDITPLDDNTKPLAKFVPLNAVQVQNSSSYNIKVKINGSDSLSVSVFAGCGVVMTGHDIDWLRVVNSDAVNAIPANELNIQIGKEFSSQLSS